VQAQLQGASLARAQLQGANFMMAQMQGATLDQAQLQGAALIGAQLQGAALIGAQLQGANLDEAQLQGAVLEYAQLQGASLNNAQLQGAFLAQPPHFPYLGNDARLDGASLRHTYVWRTYPPANPNGAFVSAPDPGPKYIFLDCPAGECDWSEKSYAALKSLIEDSVGLRNEALQHIGTLEKPPYVANDDVTEAWTNLAKGAERSSDAYFNTLARMLKEIGCAADGAPYVISSLMRPQNALRLGPVRAVSLVLLDQRFEGNPSQEAEVADAFLDKTKCPGARGLSEENKEKLQEIRDRGLPAPAGPTTAATIK
jgi:uncharacterized protein YjbI with pentapeptide repeats